MPVLFYSQVSAQKKQKMFTSWFRNLKAQARDQEVNLREAQRECLVAERRLQMQADADMAAARVAHAKGDTDTSRIMVLSSVQLRRKQKRILKQRLQLRELMNETVSIAIEPNMKQNILAGVTSLLKQANKKIKSKGALAKQQREVSKELDALRQTNRVMDEIIDETLDDDEGILSDEEEQRETEMIMSQLQDESTLAAVADLPVTATKAIAVASSSSSSAAAAAASSSLSDPHEQLNSK
jgi:hypothetical protein